MSYDSTTGDLLSSSTPDGNSSESSKTTYTYDSDGEQKTVVSPDGNVSGANAADYTTTTNYNSDGTVANVIDGATGHSSGLMPRETIYGYDADGNQTTSEDPDGNTSSAAYNADDEATISADPLGDQSLTCYDGDGNAAQSVPAFTVTGATLRLQGQRGRHPGARGMVVLQRP